jgi:hypothetical protein
MSGPAIVVIAYDRPRALRRLLGSLDRAHYAEAVPLVVSVDKGGDPSVLESAREFAWSHGPKEVITPQEHLGLRRHVLRCGDLADRFGGVVILEEDLYVSAHFYEFARQALSFYEADPQVAGVSLYLHRFNGNAGLPFEPITDGTDVFFLQLASSRGQAWTRSQWTAFRDWYARNDGPVTAQDALPAYVIAWPDTSWLKYFIKYMVLADRFFVYPRESLSTNFGDPGVHHGLASALLQVPLQLGPRPYRFQQLAGACAVYDSWFELRPDRLNRLTDALAGYDYSVDLYGTKTLESLSTPHVLTSRAARRHLVGFARSLRPPEMNVIEGVQGNDLVLCERTVVEGSRMRFGSGASTRLLEYFYPAIALRASFRLFWARLRERLVRTRS